MYMCRMSRFMKDIKMPLWNCSECAAHQDNVGVPLSLQSLLSAQLSTRLRISFVCVLVLSHTVPPLSFVSCFVTHSAPLPFISGECGERGHSAEWGEAGPGNLFPAPWCSFILSCWGNMLILVIMSWMLSCVPIMRIFITFIYSIFEIIFSTRKARDETNIPAPRNR